MMFTNVDIFWHFPPKGYIFQFSSAVAHLILWLKPIRHFLHSFQPQGLWPDLWPCSWPSDFQTTSTPYVGHSASNILTLLLFNLYDSHLPPVIKVVCSVSLCYSLNAFNILSEHSVWTFCLRSWSDPHAEKKTSHTVFKEVNMNASHVNCPSCVLSYLRSRLCTSAQASCRLSSVYMRKRMRRPQARLLVSCFNRFGFDFPLNPSLCTLKKDRTVNGNAGQKQAAEQLEYMD